MRDKWIIACIHFNYTASKRFLGNSDFSHYNLLFYAEFGWRTKLQYSTGDFCLQLESEDILNIQATPIVLFSKICRSYQLYMIKKRRVQVFS